VDGAIKQNEPQCTDVSDDSVGANQECYTNVVWAKDIGIKSHPEWYSDYSLTANSSFADFQCALHDKVGPGGGDGWNCPKPCTSMLEQCKLPVVTLPSLAVPATSEAPEVERAVEAPTEEPEVERAVEAPTEEEPEAPSTPAPTTARTTAAPIIVNYSNTTSTAAPGSSGSLGSMSSMWWALLAVLALALCGAAVYFLPCWGGKKRGPEKKKKKRAIATKTAVPEPAVPLLAPQPVMTTSAPVYVTTGTPVYTQAAPAMATAYRGAALAAAPVVQYSTAPAAAGSFVMANPPVSTRSTAIPAYGVQVGAQNANFDMIDTNHDGVISRAEFQNAVMR